MKKIVSHCLLWTFIICGLAANYQALALYAAKEPALINSFTLYPHPYGPMSAFYDSEIEQLLRDYSAPLQKAAKLPASSKIQLIHSEQRKSFTEGHNIYVTSSLLAHLALPNQIIGHLAHEMGHIKYSHIAMRQLADNFSAAVKKLNYLLHFSLMPVNFLSSNGFYSRVATNNIGEKSKALCAYFNKKYQQNQELEADRAALSFLTASGQSAKGLLTSLIAQQRLASLAQADLLPKQKHNSLPSYDEQAFLAKRISLLAEQAQRSAFYEKGDDKNLLKRHLLAQAKIIGCCAARQRQKKLIYRYFCAKGQREQALSAAQDPARDPKSKSLALAYALAIFAAESKDKQALHQAQNLIKAEPQNPFFYELLGQAYYGQQDFSKACSAYEKAIELYEARYKNKAADLYYKLGQSLMQLSLKPPYGEKQLDKAIEAFLSAKNIDKERPDLYLAAAQAFGHKWRSDIADYFLSEMFFQQGQLNKARIWAKRSLKNLPLNSPYRLNAEDIVNFDNIKIPRKMIE